MAYTTKVVVIGRRVRVVVRGFDLQNDGRLVYGNGGRTLFGRAERVEQAVTIDDDEVSAMDEILKHHERIKLDWTLTATEIKHIFNPADDPTPIPTIQVLDSGANQITIAGADALEDLLYGFSHAAVAVQTPVREKIFWGAIVGGDDTQDRNAGRNTIRIVPISLGVNGDGEEIPNPQIYAAGTAIPWGD